MVVSARNLLACALRLQLCPAGLCRIRVGVRNDNQIRALPLADGLQLKGIAFSNPLLARLPPTRKGNRMDVPAPEVAVLQEPTYERIRLRVFAEQSDADTAHSFSQPRATVSDKESPSMVRSG